ncbi:MAG TPA: ATP-binding protein, partial [Marinilabiliaceae bacterium]|nr:ATP-binding protein [Marinilabiliaceae bacterium]
MSKKILIKKASGELVPFSDEKLALSLQRSQASEETIKLVIDDISSWIIDEISTKKLYGRAFSLLRKYQRSSAARYSLKNAVMELGPEGYAFEKFVGHVFESMGFNVIVAQEIEGKCVSHELLKCVA